jgi:hypothetical protein
MIALLMGTLVSAKIKQPEAGQDFKAHQAIGLLQIEDGEPDLVKLKDMDLTRQYKPNTPVKLKCSINHWSNSNNSGNSIKILEVL